MDPFYHQPDPDQPDQVPPKPEKLVRCGPGAYYLMARRPDGSRQEWRLMPATFVRRS